MKIATAAATVSYLFLLFAAALLAMAWVGFLGWVIFSAAQLVF